MVISMFIVVFSDIRKVPVEAEKSYGSDTPEVMVV